jgi:flagellar motor protein MotB
MDLMTNIMVFFVIIWSLSPGPDDGISDTVGDVTTRLINLPGDVLFPPGDSGLSSEGRDILAKLFKDSSGQGVLSFDDNGLVKRMIVLHGHTDSDGTKDQNLELGFQRAMAAYREIESYNPQLKDHAVICTHADNSPEEEVPLYQGKISAEQRQILNELKSKNRRISIEDRTVNLYQEDE